MGLDTFFTEMAEDVFVVNALQVWRKNSNKIYPKCIYACVAWEGLRLYIIQSTCTSLFFTSS